MTERRPRRQLVRKAPLALLLSVAAGAAVCQEPPSPIDAGVETKPNLLLVVLDDVGVDRIGAYREHPVPGRTPTLDALARDGVLFRNCWSNPYCSATRATILTGRYGFRTNIGRIVDGEARGLGFDEWTIPEVLEAGSDGAYASAFFGKWHLAGVGQGADHPNESGFPHFAGSLANLGKRGGYRRWERTVDGETETCRRYATTVTVDDALAFVDEAEGPWFVVLSFNAAHVPFHAPPAALHDFELEGDPDDSATEHHKAMVQALDTELGRFLSSLEPGTRAATTVVVVADNGTQNPATTAPFVPTHGKGTLFEGGLNVPLILSGAGVEARGTECEALVSTVDVLATLTELAGVDARGVVPEELVLDSSSLVPYLSEPARESDRDFVYAEKFFPHDDGPYRYHARAVRDARYKLVRDLVRGTESFYDLALDPYETHDLGAEPDPQPNPEANPGQAVAREALVRRMAELVGGD